ncbi:hypothetical protein BCR37DRAFT_393663 [Protomyces lactucae-debilis]|uniref:Uncharacterized protein n=1 Tax=Protomyces lactucae-debilis TaxID=2754530 RepID=A0A1Y2FAU2_PROLT|nr:uncharacterized protein BCR37DRAFT_393663 [Protomyces lactucae-debilis]ORY81030.1 hypothetical protein BCR37DRAFT_393663 [Protomyces lactucae-debilis]
MHYEAALLLTMAQVASAQLAGIGLNVGLGGGNIGLTGGVAIGGGGRAVQPVIVSSNGFDNGALRGASVVLTGPEVRRLEREQERFAVRQLREAERQQRQVQAALLSPGARVVPVGNAFGRI